MSMTVQTLTPITAAEQTCIVRCASCNAPLDDRTARATCPNCGGLLAVEHTLALPKRDAEPPHTSSERLVQPAVMERGRKVYDKQCAMCHGGEGKGYPPMYPPLAGNQSITMATPVNPLRMVLNGGYPPGTRKNPRPHGMPPFSHILNDEEAAAVVTYIRTAWGNTGTPVTPSGCPVSPRRPRRRSAMSLRRCWEMSMRAPLRRSR
jgi:mono/diheme cytochrome c family protein